MQRTILLAFQLLLLLTGLTATSNALRAQEEQTTHTGWKVATGLVRSADGRMQPLPPGAEVRRLIEEDLARELAEAEVSRDFKGAAKRIGFLQMRATWKQVPQRAELLTRMSMARAQLFQRIGDTDSALRALQSLFPYGAHPELQLADVDPEDLRMQQEALQAPAVRALREQLESAAAAPPAIDDAISRAVGAGLSGGNPGNITELGRRAVPALVRLASQGTEAWIEQGRDPLFYLVGLDEARAAELILEHFDRGGPFWRRRALRAMQHADVLENDRAYLYEPRVDGRPRLIGTWWLPVVLRLVQDPETAPESLRFVRSLLLRDALDEPLVAALSRLARGSNPALVAALQKILRETGGSDGTRRILESMLDAPDALLRDFAAQSLLGYKDSPGLQAAVHSNDPKVRLAVVKSLQDRTGPIRAFDSNGRPSTGGQDIKPILDAQLTGLLVGFLRDTDPEVRHHAAWTAREKRASIPDAAWLELARDPDPKVRRDVTSVTYRASPELATALFAALATDTDPEVLAAFDSALAGYLTRLPQAGDLDPFIPAIEARYANGALPFLGNEQEKLRALTRAMLKKEGGRRIVGRWALSGASGWRLALAAEMLTALQQIGMSAARERSDVGIPYDDAEFVRFLRGGAAGSEAELFGIARRAAGLRIADPEPWRALAVDPSAADPLRLAAVNVIADRADPEVARVLVELVSRARWSPQEEQEWTGIIREALRRMPHEPARQALGGLLEKGVSANLISAAAGGFTFSHAFTPALSEPFLRRVLSGEVREQGAALAALEEVASRPPEERGTWIEQALHNRELARRVVQLLGRMREPRYLPLLVESLEAPWMTEGDERHNVRVAAIEAIGRYLDDEAVQILLDAAGRFTDAKLRQACYDELNRIKTHRATREEWELRRRAGASKDSAIAALLPMLDAKDAATRAQAARSLATLGAVEELPRLVKLLQDPDATVREAAQRALEVLNASTGTPR